MTDYKIYIIKLENNKFFLHVSLPIYEDLLFKECSLLFEFVKNNPPICIMNTIDINDVLDIDYYVKYYMRTYGIHNVRGGNYTNEIFDDNQMMFLKKEIESSFFDYDKKNEIIEDIILNNQYKTIDEIKNEKEIVEKKIKKYNNTKFLLSLLTSDDEEYLYIIENLEWLKEEIDNIRLIFENNLDSKKLLELSKFKQYLPKITIDRYKNILKNIKSIVTTYNSLDKQKLEPYLTPYLNMKFSSFKKYSELESIFIKMPQFVFDNIFLHPYSITNWDDYYEKSHQLLENLFNISYTILNIIDELKFDLSTYPEYFEMKMKYTLEYYEYT